ncbi:MAG: hypothetical protein ACD_78C00041G0002, partial [uncultured bacterium (gcode 4)]
MKNPRVNGLYKRVYSGIVVSSPKVWNLFDAWQKTHA